MDRKKGADPICQKQKLVLSEKEKGKGENFNGRQNNWM